MNRRKKMITIILCGLLVTGLTACKTENKWIFSLNGEKLYDKDVTVFGLIYAKEYNIVSKEQLKQKNADGETYAQYYKAGLEEEIISTVLLYKEAEKAKYKLTEEEEKTAKENAQALMNSYGKEWMKEQGISVSDIEKAYEMKLLGNSYMENLPEEEAGEEADTSNEQERYIKVYQVTFPTVELDENGMVKSDQDGKIKKLSDAEILKKEEEANDFVEKITAGEEMESILKEYDKSVTGMEKYIKYDDLDTGYKKAVDNLSENEVSGVISGTNGFYIVKLLESDAAEHADIIASYEVNTENQEKKAELLDSLYNTYVRDDKNYKNKEQWERVTMFSFTQ